MLRPYFLLFLFKFVTAWHSGFSDFDPLLPPCGQYLTAISQFNRKKNKQKTACFVQTQHITFPLLMRYFTGKSQRFEIILLVILVSANAYLKERKKKPEYPNGLRQIVFSRDYADFLFLGAIFGVVTGRQYAAIKQIIRLVLSTREKLLFSIH